MFSSNPFPNLPPSTDNLFSSSRSLFDLEKEGVDFHYHHRNHNQFISGDFRLHAPVNENFIMHQQQQFSEGSGLQYSEDHDDLLNSVISPYDTKMATSKKNGHSKIYTARGPRDRRVRLSIGIAQKFFFLQDLLGFDKASKTLDWLITKSLTAIKDLVEETNQSCPSSTVTEQSKVEFLETIKDHNGLKKKSVAVKCVGGKKQKMAQRCKGGIQENLARDQSRSEARARARERTKQKQKMRTVDGCESGRWGQIQPQNGYKDSNQSKDPSFQIRAFRN